MTYVEIPLWFVIAFVSLFGLCIIHNIIGDFFAKVFYKMIKEKENKNE